MKRIYNIFLEKFLRFLISYSNKIFCDKHFLVYYLSQSFTNLFNYYLC